MDLLIITLISLCIGSFLNVCIYRVPRRLSVIKPARSFCPACRAQLTTFENIPLLSWLLLRGRCRSCRAPISGQYPLVESASAIAALAAYFHFGLTLTALVVYLLCAALIVISFIDLEFKIIPDVISFPGMTLGLILGILSQYTSLFSWPVTESALDSLLGFLVGGGFFYLVGVLYYACTKRVGLGGGDIKLMGLTGAVLGIQSIWPTIFLGSTIGAAVGIAAVVIRGGSRHTEIPFGPWLSLGALIYMFANPDTFRLF